MDSVQWVSRALAVGTALDDCDGWGSASPLQARLRAFIALRVRFNVSRLCVNEDRRVRCTAPHVGLLAVDRPDTEV